jgi:acetyltransferase
MACLSKLPQAERATREGETIRIDYATRNDEAQIKSFFLEVTPEDLRFRFCETIREVDEGRIAEMVEDPLVATFLARQEDGRLAAIATFVADPDGDSAEIALSTRCDAKHHGISWTLLEFVLAVAKAHAFTSIRSFELAQHHEAIRMEKEMGFSALLHSADPAEIIASKSLVER